MHIYIVNADVVYTSAMKFMENTVDKREDATILFPPPFNHNIYRYMYIEMDIENRRLEHTIAY